MTNIHTNILYVNRKKNKEKKWKKRKNGMIMDCGFSCFVDGVD
jgi:hypothetical protein